MTTPTVQEKPNSRPLSVGSTSSHKRECIVFDAATESDAVAAILAATSIFPTTYSTTQNGITSSFIRGTAGVATLDDGRDPITTWEGTVDYELVGFSNQPYQTGDTTTTFEIGTQSVNVKQNTFAGGTGIYTASGEVRKDYKGLINVDNDGNAQGADIDVPTFTWSETHYVADASITTAYINALYAAVSNPINDNTFRDAAAGEVKILGVQGARRFRGGDWELNFKFAASLNVTSLTVGAITGIHKHGWEYLWFNYERRIQTDTASGSTFISLIATNAYVEKVYGYSDFSALGIGT
jgi:hypothetical protein